MVQRRTRPWLPALLTALIGIHAALLRGYELDPSQYWNDWKMGYYRDPRPKEILSLLEYLDHKGGATGMFQDASVHWSTAAFLSIVFRDNPDALPEWCSRLDDFGLETRWTAWLALRFAGMP